MAQVPVDIRVDIDGLGAFRKLEKSFQRLDKMADDIRLQMKERTALRQLRKVGREVDVLASKARGIDVGFNVNLAPLRKAESLMRRLQRQRAAAASSSTTAAGGGVINIGSNAAASGAAVAAGTSLGAAANNAANLMKDISSEAKVLESAIQKVEENTAAANIAAGQYKEGLQESQYRAFQASKASKVLEDNWNSIEDKANKYNAAVREVNRIDGTNRPASGVPGRRLLAEEVEAREKAVQAANELAKELKQQVKLQDQLADDAERYKQAVVSGRFQAPGIPGKKAGPVKQSVSRFAGAAAVAGKAGQALSGLGGLGLGALAGAAIKGAAALEQTTLRLRELSREYGEFDQIQKLVDQNAQTFNLSQQEAADNFAQVYARLRPLGIELDKIQTTFQGFNAVAIANGASAQEASSAFLQLSQALGSGRLQGDEFRSIAEQVPGILKLVSQEMGVTVGELKKLGSEGAITSEILINSLAAGFEKNRSTIQALIDQSPAQQFKALGNEISNTGNSIGKDLLPVVRPAVDALTELLKLYQDLPGPIRTLTALTIGLAGALGAAASAANLLGISLKAAGILAFGKVAAGAALILGPLVQIAVAMKDAREETERFESVLGSNSLGEVEGELKAQVTELNKLIDAYEAMDREDPFYNQYGDVERLKGEIERATEKVVELTKRRDLIIDLKINPLFDNTKDITQDAGFQRQLTEQLKKLGLQRNSDGPVTDIVDDSAINKAKQEAELRQRQLEAAQDLLFAEKNRAKLLGDMTEAERIKAQGAVTELQIERQYQKLLSKSMSAEETLTLQLAEQEAYKNNQLGIEQQLAALRENALSGIDDEIGLLKARLNGTEDVYQREKDIQDLMKNGSIDRAEAAARVDELNHLRALADEAERLTDFYSEMAGIVVDGLGQAFQDVITGASSMQEALSNAFKEIGESFNAMALDIIKDQIRMIINGMILKALGVTVGGQTGSANTAPAAPNGTQVYGGQLINTGIMSASGGGYTGNAPRAGGLDGEGGFLAVLHPQETVIDHHEPMGRYNAGGGGAGGSHRTISFQSEVINNVEYVTAEQAMAMSRAAADDGARRGAAGGESRVMSSLRNRRSARSRIGLR